jgi:hypothetical protein
VPGRSKPWAQACTYGRTAPREHCHPCYGKRASGPAFHSPPHANPAFHTESTVASCPAPAARHTTGPPGCGHDALAARLVRARPVGTAEPPRATGARTCNTAVARRAQQAAPQQHVQVQTVRIPADGTLGWTLSRIPHSHPASRAARLRRPAAAPACGGAIEEGSNRVTGQLRRRVAAGPDLAAAPLKHLHRRRLTHNSLPTLHHPNSSSSQAIAAVVVANEAFMLLGPASKVGPVLSASPRWTLRWQTLRLTAFP